VAASVRLLALRGPRTEKGYIVTDGMPVTYINERIFALTKPAPRGWTWCQWPDGREFLHVTDQLEGPTKEEVLEEIDRHGMWPWGRWYRDVVKQVIKE
jgi:hypothetical protein